MQLMRQHIQQHFGIRIGIDVAQVIGRTMLLQLFVWSDCRCAQARYRTANSHRNAAPHCDHKPNRLWGSAHARCRVAGQCTHVAGTKHVATSPLPLCKWNVRPSSVAIPAASWPAMLQDLQAVIQQLIGWCTRDHSRMPHMIFILKLTI